MAVLKEGQYHPTPNRLLGVSPFLNKTTLTPLTHCLLTRLKTPTIRTRLNTSFTPQMRNNKAEKLNIPMFIARKQGKNKSEKAE